jgi:hypothetical protein
MVLLGFDYFNLYKSRTGFNSNLNSALPPLIVPLVYRDSKSQIYVPLFKEEFRLPKP